MANLSSLQKKRADLCAAREQYVGQINRTNGAIDLLDDLIAEAQQEEVVAQPAPTYDAAYHENVLDQLQVVEPVRRGAYWQNERGEEVAAPVTYDALGEDAA